MRKSCSVARQELAECSCYLIWRSSDTAEGEATQRMERAYTKQVRTSTCYFPEVGYGLRDLNIILFSSKCSLCFLPRNKPLLDLFCGFDPWMQPTSFMHTPSYSNLLPLPPVCTVNFPWQIRHTQETTLKLQNKERTVFFSMSRFCKILSAEIYLIVVFYFSQWKTICAN